jgi:hypothetical protein
MAKTLKPLIIVLLLMSIASLVLGVLLYEKREFLQGRADKLAQGAVSVAGAIGYQNLSDSALGEYEQVDSAMTGLSRAAKVQHDELVDTSERLATTKGELDLTRKNLEITETELQDTQNQVTELESTVTAKNQEITRKDRKISGLEDSNGELTSQVDQMGEELNLAKDDMEIRVAEKESLQKAYDELYEDWIVATTGKGTGGGVDADIDISGQVLVVSAEWNFVVIDKGSLHELKPNVLLLVHRNTEPVGKILIKKVEEEMSIGEIVQAWEGRTLVEGDEFISPKAPSSS